MKPHLFRAILERISFYLWIAFTILSISVAGLGLEGMVFASIMLMASSTQSIPFPIAMVSGGGIGVFLSIFWRQVGIDHLHYLDYDSLMGPEEDEETPSHMLQTLIHEVEVSTGYARNDARVKAKTWLIDHVDSLEEEDILLARVHFGYLLPAEWGLRPVTN